MYLLLSFYLGGNMKILAAVLLLTSTLAQAKEIANYRFAIRDNVSQELFVINAKLDDNKVLQIKGQAYEDTGHGPIFFPSPANREILEEKVLNTFSYENLFSKIKTLSTAKIKTTHAQIVCAMMPGPTASNDHLTVRRDWNWEEQDLIGDMLLVSGPSGCWVSTSIKPETDWGKREASNLKNQLKILALDMLNI